MEKGCGTVAGTAKFKDADGKVVATSHVSGKVCVHGIATVVLRPFVGRTWEATVWGAVTLSGTVQ